MSGINFFQLAGPFLALVQMTKDDDLPFAANDVESSFHRNIVFHLIVNLRMQRRVLLSSYGTFKCYITYKYVLTSMCVCNYNSTYAANIKECCIRST